MKQAFSFPHIPITLVIDVNKPCHICGAKSTCSVNGFRCCGDCFKNGKMMRFLHERTKRLYGCNVGCKV